MIYRISAKPVEPAFRPGPLPALTWWQRHKHAFVWDFNLAEEQEWRKWAGGRWANIGFLNTRNQAPRTDVAVLLLTYGGETPPSWQDSFSCRWRWVTACPHDPRDNPPRVTPQGLVFPECKRCEVWP